MTGSSKVKEDSKTTVYIISPNLKEALVRYLGTCPHAQVDELDAALKGGVVMDVDNGDLAAAFAIKNAPKAAVETVAEVAETVAEVVETASS